MIGDSIRAVMLGSLPEPKKQRLLWAWMDRNHFLSVSQGYANSLLPVELESLMRRQQKASASRSRLRPIAKETKIEPMGSEHASHLDAVKSSPYFQKVFAGLDSSFGMVDPNDLVVFQHFIQPPKGELPADVLRWCLPTEFKTEAQITINGTHSVVFVTQDHTSIFGINVDPQKGPILGLQPRGNWLQVSRVEGRLVLRNGIHRAVRLAHAGHARIPALVVEYQSMEEVVPADPGFFNANYLRTLERPPLLTDFLNPELAVDIPLEETRRIVAVRLEVSDYRIPIR